MFLTRYGLEGGQTNVDTLGLQRFAYFGMLDANMVSKIENQVYFANAKGRTRVKVVDIPSKGGVDPTSLQVVATTPLAPDTWHWLVVDQDQTLRVVGSTGSQWKTHFFTGSAPRIVAVMGSTLKNPDFLYIAFSEPVDAATIEATGLVKMGGKTVSKCILRGGTCMDKTAPFVSESFDVQLDTSFSPVDTVLALSGNVAGSGRSVAEGAVVTGDPFASGKATTFVAATAWSSCENASAFCWKDPAPLPAP